MQKYSFTEDTSFGGKYHITFSNDGKSLLLLLNQRFLLFDTETLQVPTEIKNIPKYDFVTAELSPNNKLLAAGTSSGGILLFDLTTQKTAHVLSAHQDKIIRLIFNPAGNILLSQSYNGEIKLWDAQTGRELATLVTLDGNAWAAVTPKGLFDSSPNADKIMHFVIGLEPIALEQLEKRYHEPGLLAKLTGFDKRELRTVPAFTGKEMFPEVKTNDALLAVSKILLVNLKNRGGGIGRVQIFVNDKEFIADARPPNFNPNQRQTELQIDLSKAIFASGEKNQIRVAAYNAEGFMSSRGIELVYDDAQEKSTAPPEFYAIIAGVSDYASGSLHLNYAAKDAEDFARAIRAGANKFYGADKTHLTILSTAGGAGTILPTKENLRKAFDEVAEKAKIGDVFLVYFAGHGVSFAISSDKTIYSYLTQDANSADVSDSVVRGANAVTDDELAEWLKKIAAGKRILILDTCNAGAIALNRDLATNRNADSNQIRALNRLKQVTAFHILMGSAANKSSYEASEYAQGLLTYALLEGLKFGAVNDEGVKVGALFQYARERVPVLSGNIGASPQVPEIMSPNAVDFQFVRMTSTESLQIALAKSRPIVLRPRFFNLNNEADRKLENALRECLREIAEPMAQGSSANRLRETPLVYLDDAELSTAILPSGSYRVEGAQTKISLTLTRNEQKVDSFEIISKQTDFEKLVEEVTAKLLQRLIALHKSGT